MAEACDGVSHHWRSSDGDTCLTRKSISRYAVVSEIENLSAVRYVALKKVSLSALRASRPLPRGRFLVLISVRGWVEPRAIVWLEGLGQYKKTNDLSGNRTRDFPACSIVPLPNTLPRALM
jgi:hypothetical protein